MMSLNLTNANAILSPHAIRNPKRTISSLFKEAILLCTLFGPICTLEVGLLEVIRQYDSSNTGELHRHAQHQQPCLASRTLRVVVWQEQPVLSGTHWSSFAHRQMSVVLCLRRFAMKIENWHIRHQRPPQGHQRPPRYNTCTPHKLESYSCCLTGTTLPLVLGVRQRCSRCRNDPCHSSRTAEYPPAGNFFL